jgi:hypothetical protein
MTNVIRKLALEKFLIAANRQKGFHASHVVTLDVIISYRYYTQITSSAPARKGGTDPFPSSYLRFYSYPYKKDICRAKITSLFNWCLTQIYYEKHSNGGNI